jgi:hypothetical protein
VIGPLLERRDRRGTLVARARFASDGGLASAWVRIPDGSWVGIEPRATHDAPWGLSDRTWHAPRGSGAAALEPPATFAACVPLTVFAAVDWARVDRLVPGAEPARLPPGAAPPLFNLVATLARAQGVAALQYAGPYPSESLFLGLLEAFRPLSGGADPLGAFQRGALGWAPDPHEPLFAEDDLYVQLRGRVEKVVWRGVTYHRPDWHGIVRHAARRVRDAEDGVRCGLWVLGGPLVDHLVLASDGTGCRVLESSGPPTATEPAPPEVWAGVVAAVVAMSAAPLAARIRALARELTLEWGPLDRTLVRVEGPRVRAEVRLRHALAEKIEAAPDADARAGVALAALAELAAEVGDALRGRAQAWLAARPEAEQRQALETLGEPAGGPDEARAIATAAAALVREIAGSRPAA